MDKHTPLPWEACQRGDYTDDGIVILGDDRRVAVVNEEEDADFIVGAVNTNGKLIGALMPFARHALLFSEGGEFGDHDDDVVVAGLASSPITVGDFRRAINALGGLYDDLHAPPQQQE